jgi:short-subunit dehydrogenase
MIPESLAMLKSPTDSESRAAIVTGASSGIGEATSRRLAAAGFDVALVARRGDRLETIAKEIEVAGGRAIAIVADLADADETSKAFRRAVEFLGRIDVLVNNAGFSPGAAIEQLSREELRNIFDVNLFSALQLCGHAAPLMRAQRAGRIINVGSLAGSIPAPLAIPYAASKVALHASSDALRLELAPWNIDVSLVIPGFVDTAVFDNAREGAEHLRNDPDNPYRLTMFKLDELALKNLENPLSPDDLAKIILHAATARRPKARYYAPFSALVQSGVFRMLPARMLDWILMRVYGLERG